VHLPVVDCLPYRVHNNILEKMKPPPGAISDSTVITMVYEKNGKPVEFDASQFPADFNDSYHFVKRYDKLIRKGNNEAAIKDFNLHHRLRDRYHAGRAGGEGVYDPAFLAKQTGPARPAEQGGDDWHKYLWLLFAAARHKNIPLMIVTSDYDGVMEWEAEKGESWPVLKCDATAVKTAAKGRSDDLPFEAGNGVGKVELWPILNEPSRRRE